jgi:DNA-binding transcriptional LysR family regulator
VELEHLRRFVVLARELHFGRAAEKVGTAQPTLSLQVAALERELGVPLFERTKRRVALTDAGAVFLREVEGIIDGFDRAARYALEASQGRRGNLFVGASSPALNSWVPAAIRAFAATHQDVEISLDVMPSRFLIDALRQRKLHLVFARSGISEFPLESQVLTESRFDVILPSGHPLAARSSVRLRDLEGERLITFSRAQIQESYDHLIAFCRSEGFHPTEIKEVDGFDSIIGLVACGLGISIVPDTGVHGGSTVVRPIAVSSPSSLAVLGTAMYWHPDDPSPIRAAFMNDIRELTHRNRSERGREHPVDR